MRNEMNKLKLLQSKFVLRSHSSRVSRVKIGIRREKKKQRKNYTEQEHTFSVCHRNASGKRIELVQVRTVSEFGVRPNTPRRINQFQFESGCLNASSSLPSSHRVFMKTKRVNKFIIIKYRGFAMELFPSVAFINPNEQKQQQCNSISMLEAKNAN